eukprot:7740616-Pyramimonas_sp.AAC.1
MVASAERSEMNYEDKSIDRSLESTAVAEESSLGQDSEREDFEGIFHNQVCEQVGFETRDGERGDHEGQDSNHRNCIRG